MNKLNARKTSVALLSVISNAMLIALKLIIGLAIGSVSVISEAIHSGVDLLAAVLALFAVRTAAKPADEDHPFGHQKMENISGTVEALLIFLAAVWIIFEAIKKLMHPAPLDAPGWGVAIMLVSAVTNIIVSKRLFKVGKETDSVALQADAWHHWTDVFTSAGVMAGLGLIWLGELVFKGMRFNWIDPIAAICVALLIIKAAYHLTVQSSRDLMDVSLPPEEEKVIKDHIAGRYPVVRAFHRLRTRKAGSQRFIQFHLLVSADMSVEESHKLHDEIVTSIKEHFPGSIVTIHIEPCDGECKTHCIGCLMSDEDKARIREEVR